MASIQMATQWNSGVSDELSFLDEFCITVSNYKISYVKKLKIKQAIFLEAYSIP